jgi:hypothetical protein
LLKFLPEHPFSKTHSTRWIAADKARIPNFIGATVPRHDQGDREYYCSSMLTLFKPWRTGLDLKCTDNMWDDAFKKFIFSDRQKSIMANMNIRYECLDARDDFHAQMKKGEILMPSWMEDDNTLWNDLEQTIADDCLDTADTEIIPDIHISTVIGKGQLRMQAMMVSMRRTLTDAGWTICNANLLPPDLQLQLKPVTVSKTPAQWNNMVVSARGHILEERAQFMPQTLMQNKTGQKGNFVPNEVKIVNKAHLERRCQPVRWQKLIDKIAKDFKLNKEQERAYRIVANHSCNEDAEQLKMNLAGMAGTGKLEY